MFCRPVRVFACVCTRVDERKCIISDESHFDISWCGDVSIFISVISRMSYVSKSIRNHGNENASCGDFYCLEGGIGI